MYYCELTGSYVLGYFYFYCHYSGGYLNAYFVEEIPQGLLFEMADQILSLTELFKFGSLLDFQGAAVWFIVEVKKLQIFPEVMLSLCL